MCGHIFCGAREVPGKNWSSGMQGAHEGDGRGAGRVPAGNLTGFRPMSRCTDGSRNVPCRGPAGVLKATGPGAVRCTEIESESEKNAPLLKRLYYLKYEYLIMGFMIYLDRVIPPVHLGTIFIWISACITEYQTIFTRLPDFTCAKLLGEE